MVVKYIVTQALKAGVKKAPKKSNWKTVWQPVREVDETGKSKGPHLLMKVQTKKGKD